MKRFLIKLWRAITFADKRLNKLKLRKFEEFKKRNAVAINRIQPVAGKRVLPCIWHPVKKDWIWVNRSKRRRAEMIVRRSPA